MNNEFFLAFKLMWQGMATLFIVMSVIAVIVYLYAGFLNKRDK